MGLFKSGSKSCIGIDIGTSSIKMVQLKRSEGRFKLETYGELQTYGYLERLNDPFHTKSLRMLETQVIELTRKLLKAAGATAKDLALSVPIFSSFVSTIEIPPMSEEELSKALIYEARRHVPIPLSEVRVDWRVIEKQKIDSVKSSTKKNLFKYRVLLVAVPKEIIAKYLRIAKGLKLNLRALELESFSYIRSLMGDDLSSACILDIGARSTSFTIVDKGFLQMSHSLDIAGAELTRALAHGLGVDFKRAELYKRQKGLDHKELIESNQEIKDIILTLVDKIVIEIERIIDSYQTKTGREITKLVLSGGSGGLLGLRGYLEKKLNTKVIEGNPWARVVYPPVLEPILLELAPRFAVAVGLAMREV